MKRAPRLVAVLGCLCMLTATARSAAVPTQETMVVSRSDDDITTESSVDPSVSSEVVTESATEGHTPPIKLTEMDVKSLISLRYAQTAVVAHMRNPANRAQEASFRVLLPDTAFISGFVMTIDGKSYKAYVKEKEEAKQIYQEAVSQGFGAAHVAAKARDSNQFTVTVNVEAASKVIFNLTYEELLVRRSDVYHHVINLQPGALVPKFTVTVTIKESEDITELRVPEMRTGNEIDATKDDAQLANVVIEKKGHEAVITFAPDLDEQKRLMEIYAEKSKQSADHEVNAEGVLGQFVVQYDVARPKDGEILINDGYFVHFFAPKDLVPLSKHVVFVLDTSGSMMGRKIEQLKVAMQTILSELNPGDYFSIVDFDSTVTIHNLDEANQEPPNRHYYYNDVQQKLTLVAPSQATPENIEKARVIVNRLDAFGGTNIESALSVAMDLINKRGELAHAENNVTKTDVTEAKDSETKVTETKDSEAKVTETPVTSTSLVTPGTTKDTSVAEPSVDKDKFKNLESIIIFLTDGDPTVGVINTKTIINHITEKNYGENKAALYSLGFGEDADIKFLRKLSLRNNGFERHIYEAADAALQLLDFYRQVSSPLLADVKFVYPPDQVNADSVTKHKFRTYFAGSETVVAGRVAPAASSLEPQVHAFCGVVDDVYARKKYEKTPKVPVPAEKHENLPLERMWAYLTIKQLLDERDAAEDNEDDKNKENSPEKKALALALKYEFVTSLTSLVVVKPNETNAVNAESVDKQNHDHLYASYHSSSSQLFAPLSLNSYRPMSATVGGLSGAGFGGQALSAARPMYVSSLHLTNHRVVNHKYPALNSYPISGFISTPMAYNDLVEEDDYDAVPEVLSTTPSPISITLKPVGLSTYHLLDYPWTEPLLDFANDALVLQANVNVTLKLTQDVVAPKKAGGDEECAAAVDGGAGLCVYLTRCDAARNITVDVYKTTYCLLDAGYAGVCCQRSKIDLVSVH